MMSLSNSTGAVLSKSGSLLKALDALSNWRAVLLMALTMVAAMLVMMLGTKLAIQLGSASLIGLFSLLSLVVFVIGYSATGFIMMDTALGQTPRGAVDALLASLFSVHRLFLAILVLGIAYILWVVVLSLLLFVCKIPALGPVLYTLIFPLGIIVSGVFTVFLFYAGGAVIAPAVWEGDSVIDTLAKVWAVAKNRFLALVILTLLLGLMIWVVGGLIIGIFFAGITLTGGLSASILGAQMPGVGMLMGMLGGGMGDMQSMAMMSGGDYANYSSTGYLTAAGIGGGALFCLVIAIPTNILVLGICINYLQLIDGLDVGAAKQELHAKLDEAKRGAMVMKTRAEELQQQRKAQKQAQNTQAEPASVEAQAPVATGSNLNCPACSSAITEEDAFCGNCGSKLK